MSAHRPTLYQAAAVAGFGVWGLGVLRHLDGTKAGWLAGPYSNLAVLMTQSPDVETTRACRTAAHAARLLCGMTWSSLHLGNCVMSTAILLATFAHSSSAMRAAGLLSGTSQQAASCSMASATARLARLAPHAAAGFQQRCSALRCLGPNSADQQQTWLQEALPAPQAPP